MSWPVQVELQPGLTEYEEHLMSPGSSLLGFIPLQAQCPAWTQQRAWSQISSVEFLSPLPMNPRKWAPIHSSSQKLGAVMNSHHEFPKPQCPEHLPEQARDFPKPCPSQPIVQRHSVPQLYSGKCSLNLRMPDLSRTTVPGARQHHRASLLL